jgi:multisubunit Na+/H+ antiporter MnhB subunit
VPNWAFNADNNASHHCRLTLALGFFKMLRHLVTTIAKVATAILVGLLTFAFTGYALRPYTPITEALHLTTPEWTIAAFVGAGFALVTVWRLLAESSIKQELNAFFKAISEGDSLD